MKSSRSGTSSFFAAWPLWCAALWWGSLTTLGFGVVPLLFAYLPGKALAGSTAASLFGVQAIASVVLGASLLMVSSVGSSVYAGRTQAARGFVLAGMLMALLVEFAVAPRIVARENLALWHAVGSTMLLLQWMCAGVTFWIIVKPAGDDPL